MPKCQSWDAQEERLDTGRCPIHGIPMYQVGRWYRLPNSDKPFTIVACTRADCDVYATETEAFGRAELLPKNVKVYGYYVDDYPMESEDRTPIEIWPGDVVR